MPRPNYDKPHDAQSVADDTWCQWDEIGHDVGITTISVEGLPNRLCLLVGQEIGSLRQ